MNDQTLAIGIDFGGTSVKIGVLKRGTVVEEAPRIDTQVFESARPLIERINETCNELRSRHTGIEAIGVGMPGFVDFPTGMVHNLTNVKGWQRIYLKRELNELSKLPVTVENDANCMAYAEWKRGAGRGLQNLVAVTLGTGVGGGFVVENRLVRGANYVAGELGQTSIDYQGPAGAYGNRGSLEDYVGNQQITDLAFARYQEAGQARERSECTPAHLSDLAQSGNEIALEIWDTVARMLSTSLMNCCWILNPEAIIIGGGVAQAGAVLFDPLEKHLRGQLGDPFKENLRILPARFSNEAGIVGAATLALEEAGFNVDG
jgi:glucokinase